MYHDRNKIKRIWYLKALKKENNVIISMAGILNFENLVWSVKNNKITFYYFYF